MQYHVSGTWPDRPGQLFFWEIGFHWVRSSYKLWIWVAGSLFPTRNPWKPYFLFIHSNMSQRTVGPFLPLSLFHLSTAGFHGLKVFFKRLGDKWWENENKKIKKKQFCRWVFEIWTLFYFLLILICFHISDSLGFDVNFQVILLVYFIYLFPTQPINSNYSSNKTCYWFYFSFWQVGFRDSNSSANKTLISYFHYY